MNLQLREQFILSICKLFSSSSTLQLCSWTVETISPVRCMRSKTCDIPRWPLRKQRSPTCSASCAGGYERVGLWDRPLEAGWLLRSCCGLSCAFLQPPPCRPWAPSPSMNMAGLSSSLRIRIASPGSWDWML